MDAPTVANERLLTYQKEDLYGHILQTDLKAMTLEFIRHVQFYNLMLRKGRAMIAPLYIGNLLPVN
jgi:hypothetical protein